MSGPAPWPRAVLSQVRMESRL
ncbi:MAG: hypothetical protein QOI52_730, partial [Chloroflexota bacterium]|nr:hypothetical protein [Chloroflexota bacterium]